MNIVKNEIAAGNKDALSWMNGEGYIKVIHSALSKSGEFEARYVRFKEERTGIYANQLRNKIYERDKYKCQHCGNGGKLNVHHIKSWAEYPSKRYDIDNGITLCRDCHAKLHPKIANLIRKAHYKK